MRSAGGRETDEMTGRESEALAQPVIRLARTEDAGAIGDLQVRSWQAAYAGIVPASVLDRLSPDRRARFWSEAIARQLVTPGSERTWVIEEDRQVVGFASSGKARDDDLSEGTGELHAIYLAPEAWSRGLGGRLLEHTVMELEALKLDPLVLWVIATNERARSLYERYGWHPDGARRPLDFDGTPVDEIRYRRVMGTPDR